MGAERGRKFGKFSEKLENYVDSGQFLPVKNYQLIAAAM
jgi:hypothetical protein